MAPQARRHRGDSGFAVVQILIVFAIVGAVAALAIPVYASRAKESVLKQNAETLEHEVKSYLALDLDATYVAGSEASTGTEATGKRKAGEVITRALQGGAADGLSAFYVNPLSGSRAVLCQTALPLNADGTSPAIWITDDQRYAFAAFSASLSTQRQLRGTLMIVFITNGGRTSAIEVYYVDGAGQRSPTAATLAL